MNECKMLQGELKNVLALLDSLLATGEDLEGETILSCENRHEHEYLVDAVVHSEQCCDLANDLRRRCSENEEYSQSISLSFQKSNFRKTNLETQVRIMEEALDGFIVPPANSLTESVCQLLAQQRKFDDSVRLLRCTCIASALHKGHAGN